MGQLLQDTWKVVHRAIKRQVRKLLRRQGRFKRATYSDELVAGMYFWSVLHDRPQEWAADKSSYGAWYRPRKLLSRSQFGRRIKMPRFQQLLQMIHHDLAGSVDLSALSYLDGKPLTVGAASKDADAKRGHVMGGYAKGYKLHIWGTDDRRIPLWSVESLNTSEPVVAEALCRRMPVLGREALVLADGGYDCQRLFEALAHKNAGLIAKPRGMDLDDIEGWARSRHPKSKDSGPLRMEALAAWKAMPDLTRWVYRDRIHVEGTFSNLCTFAGGLGPLPSWVRGLERVRRWVGAKIIIYHARWRSRKAREKA